MQGPIIPDHMKLDSFVLEVIMIAIMAGSSLIGILNYWSTMVTVFFVLPNLLLKELLLLQRSVGLKDDLFNYFYDIFLYRMI